MYWVYDLPAASLALLLAVVFVGSTWLGTIRPFFAPAAQATGGSQ